MPKTKRAVKNKHPLSKNLMILKLLIVLPEFQKDVIKIREEFGIKKEGFKWYKNERFEWATKNNIWYYEGNEDDCPEEDYRPHINAEDTRNSFPSNPFEKRMYEIGVKYRLPYNFYAFPYGGVPKFILSNELEAPFSNYEIDFKMHESTLLWTSLIVYAPLSKKEATKAKEYLTEMQSGFLAQFFKDYYVFAEKNTRNNMERDIDLLTKQQTRLEKPKKITVYREGSYVSILSKSKDFTDKKKKIVQRKNKKDAIVKFNELTSKEIGEIQGVSGEVTRQSKTRLNSLAKELFGYGLES